MVMERAFIYTCDMRCRATYTYSHPCGYIDSYEWSESNNDDRARAPRPRSDYYDYYYYYYYDYYYHYYYYYYYYHYHYHYYHYYHYYYYYYHYYHLALLN